MSVEDKIAASDKQAKQRVDIMFDSIYSQFPELDKLQLRFAISNGFTEIALKGINEEVQEDNEYTVEYWFMTREGYDFNTVKVMASSPEEAIEQVKNDGGIDVVAKRFIKTPRIAKKFSIVEDE